MTRPKTHDQELKTTLLNSAGELLSAEGPHSLSLRRLAKNSHTSTTAVYSLFGGKAELLEEMYREAFRRLSAVVSAIPSTDNPGQDMIIQGRAYRDNALRNRHLYAIMFSNPVEEFSPSVEATATAWATLNPMIDACRRLLIQHGLDPDRDREVATACWGAVHGLISLELNGYVTEGVDPDLTYEFALQALVSGCLYTIQTTRS